MSCSICDEKFTSLVRKKINCINNDCEINYCLECFKNYLLKSEDYDQSCMLCSASYNLGDIFAQCNSAGFIKEIMEKVTSISLNNQKNLLPQSQPAAKIIINERDFAKWNKEYYANEIMPLYAELRKKEKHIEEERRRMCGSETVDKLKKEEIHYTFIKECSHNDCKGLLSKAWKCPLCEKFTCSKCHEPKENDDHVCNEDVAKNIEALKKDSKPCPKCGTGIFKINGCDQMYCISCHTAFSWRTGKIETGQVHNPEFFRYQRDNNIEIPRNPLDGRGFEINDCFDPLERNNWPQVTSYYNRQIRKYISISNLNMRYSNMSHTLHSLARYVTHTKIIILGYYDNNLQDQLSTLRVDYLVNNIDEKKWVQEIKKKTKACHKNKAQYDIINTLLQIWGDIIMNIIYIFEDNINVKEKITDQLKIFLKYVDITNSEIKKTRSYFKSTERSYFKIDKKDNNEDYTKLYNEKDLPFIFNISWGI